MESDTNQLAGNAEQLQLVTFKLGGEEFGVNILNVQEINKVVDITEVPKSPEFVEGIINLRGKVIPVVDLRKRFYMEAKANDQHTRIIVAELDGKTIGFRVDAVNEVLRIKSDSLEAPPEIVSGVDSAFFKAVVKMGEKLLILIDLGKLFSYEEREELQSVA